MPELCHESPDRAVQIRTKKGRPPGLVACPELLTPVVVLVPTNIALLVSERALVACEVGRIASGGCLAAATDVLVQARPVAGDVVPHLGNPAIIVANILALIAPILSRRGGGAGSKQPRCQRESCEIF